MDTYETKQHVFEYSPFDRDTDPGLRDQILFYHMSDILTDSERARLLGLPEGCRIRERAKILEPKNLTLGKYVWIGEGAVLDAQGGLSIGDYTQIGLSVMVWSHSTHLQAVRGETGISRANIEYKPTKIGSNCFIAGPSVIGPGVSIGDRVIISPLSFVNRDVPDDTIVSTTRQMRDLEKRVGELTQVTAALVGLLQQRETPGDNGDLAAILKRLERLTAKGAA
jgi:acetyltransferase-like isoleucine patch superfamily enzyme